LPRSAGRDIFYGLPAKPGSVRATVAIEDV
jgi:hypothetical protein